MFCWLYYQHVVLASEWRKENLEIKTLCGEIGARPEDWKISEKLGDLVYVAISFADNRCDACNLLALDYV